LGFELKLRYPSILLTQAILNSSLDICHVQCALLSLFVIKGSATKEDKYYKLSKRLCEEEKRN